MARMALDNEQEPSILVFNELNMNSLMNFPWRNIILRREIKYLSAKSDPNLN